MKIEIANLVIQSVIALSAVIALFQILVSKRNFELNSKRESIKYSSELIKMFIDNIIPMINRLNDTLETIKFKPYRGDFNLQHFSKKEVLNLNNNITKHLLYSIAIIEPIKKTDTLKKAVDLINALETLSTPFIEKVADEEVAFRSIGQSFCDCIERIYFMYALIRHNHNDKYNSFQNTINLYNIWKQRIKEVEKE